MIHKLSHAFRIHDCVTGAYARDTKIFRHTFYDRDVSVLISDVRQRRQSVIRSWSISEMDETLIDDDCFEDDDDGAILPDVWVFLIFE